MPRSDSLPLCTVHQVNPAEAIATLQRIKVTATEKLQLFRDLNLETVAGPHPDGMLAHAQAGLPVHSGEAEASMVEAIRASPATDHDKAPTHAQTAPKT